MENWKIHDKTGFLTFMDKTKESKIFFACTGNRIVEHRSHGTMK